MKKILVSEGINYLLELPKEEHFFSLGRGHFNEEAYELAKAAAIAEAKKNGRFEDQQEVTGALPVEAWYVSGIDSDEPKLKDGIYDLPEGLETERRQQSRKKGNAEWLDGEPMVYADGSEWEYRFIVRITKQKQ